jgi:hypothetical protein
MSTVETTADITVIVNALLQALLPAINQNLPALIKEEGLDPMKLVYEDDPTLASIDLGVCTAKLIAKYSIKNMTGLSSIWIDSATATDVTANGLHVTGNVSLAARLRSNLKADVSGGLRAKCGFIDESADIDGTATAIDVTGTGTGVLSATLDEQQACLTEVFIKQMKLDFKDINVKVDGLGVFNDYLNDLVDVIEAAFGSAIKSEVSRALTPVFNDLLASLLPLCAALPQPPAAAGATIPASAIGDRIVGDPRD